MNHACRLIKAALAVLAVVVVCGCASSSLPGYQNTYQGYNIPQTLMDRIAAKFAENGLRTATVSRDNVGRVKLAGSYANEDEVERAFIIVQSIVGLKSTSPFYPDDVKVKRWELEAARAMSGFTRPRPAASAPAQKRALVMGINTYLDGTHLRPIQGEDDARLVRDQLQRGGYRVTALLGAQATKAGFEAAITQMQNELGPNDTLFIYVSSHGTPPVPSPRGGDDRRMSIIAYDSGDIGGRKSRDVTDYLLNLQATSVRDTLLQELAQKPTLVTRVFIDTCYSGEILRDVPDESRAYILKTNGGQVERAGVAMSSWSGPQYASKGISYVPEGGNASTNKGAPTARVPIDRRSGYTIITATSEGQQSLGPPPGVGVFASPLEPTRTLRGSFFTQSFFEYLGVHDGQVAEAFDDARRFTQQKALAVSGGQAQQVPRQYSTMPPTDNNLFR